MAKLKLPAEELEQNGIKRVIPFNKGNDKGNIVFGNYNNMKSAARKKEDKRGTQTTGRTYHL
jgi:hypothetical protein